MSKKEYLRKLKRELKSLPKGEASRAVDYYSELIDDRIEAGATEEAAISVMAEPKAAAMDIIADARERGVAIKKNDGRGGWAALAAILIILSVCALAFAAWALITQVFDRDITLAKIEWQEKNAVCTIDRAGEITIDMARSDLYLGCSEDDQVHITYYECDQIKVDIAHTENSISIVQKGKLRWLYDLFGSDTRRQTKVLIPAGFEGHIDSSLTTGETRVDGLICPVGKVDLHATTGDFIVYDSAMHDVSFTMTTGALILGRCTVSGDVTVKGTTGDVDIQDLGGSQLIVKTTTGDIELKSVVFTYVDARLTTGRITLTDVTAKTLLLHSTTGSIGVDNVSAWESTITATTGSISGTLSGSITDYTIESHVSTGHNSLPETFGNGPRKLFVKATTGDISVSFTENN